MGCPPPPPHTVIAATGAALVTLIEHAGDERAPIEATWVLSLTTSLALLSIGALLGTLQDDRGPDIALNRTRLTMLAAAAIAILTAAWRPSPLTLVVVLATMSLSIAEVAMNTCSGTERQGTEVSPYGVVDYSSARKRIREGASILAQRKLLGQFVVFE